jgi:hypothetical protein
MRPEGLLKNPLLCLFYMNSQKFSDGSSCHPFDVAQDRSEPKVKSKSKIPINIGDTDPSGNLGEQQVGESTMQRSLASQPRSLVALRMTRRAREFIRKRIGGAAAIDSHFE